MPFSAGCTIPVLPHYHEGRRYRISTSRDPRIGTLRTCNKGTHSTLTMKCIGQQQRYLNSSTLNASVKVEANLYGSKAFVPWERMI